MHVLKATVAKMGGFHLNELYTKAQRIPQHMCDVIMPSLRHNYIIIDIFRILTYLSNDTTSVLVRKR